MTQLAENMASVHSLIDNHLHVVSVYKMAASRRTNTNAGRDKCSAKVAGALRQAFLVSARTKSSEILI
jgi:hypothetical protein